VQDNHAVVERYERAWLAFGMVMIVVFIGLTAYIVTSHGNTIPRGEGVVQASKVRSEGEFANPRVVETTEGYTVYTQAFTYGYLPTEIRVKKNKPVTFLIVSPDVQHGFYLEGTNINPQIVPGYVTKVVHTFKKAATHRIVCNEYCGIGHAAMFGKVVVEE
jgi:cytochrome c oxidase subunit 2